jgi:stage V sporulation protein S
MVANGPQADSKVSQNGTIPFLKVAATSRCTAVAGAIAGMMRERGFAEVQAIGPSAVNRAVKAIAIAKTYLTEDGIAIICTPHFIKADLNGQERTAIQFRIEARPLAANRATVNSL